MSVPPPFYPCSKGLLVSMAMRYTHDFGQDEAIFAGVKFGHSQKDRETLLNEMHALYLKFTAPGYVPESSGSNSQIYEELVGLGFYGPEQEEWYAGHWPGHYVPKFKLDAPLPLPEDKGPHKTQFRCNNCCEEFEAFDFSEHTCTPIGGSD